MDLLRRNDSLATVAAEDLQYVIMPVPAQAIFAAGRQNDVPLAGWNRDEVAFESLSTPKPMAPVELAMKAKKESGPKSGEFLKLYPYSTADLAYRSKGRHDSMEDRALT